MATHSSILAWRNPMDRRVWRATAHGIAKSQMYRLNINIKGHPDSDRDGQKGISPTLQQRKVRLRRGKS